MERDRTFRLLQCLGLIALSLSPSIRGIVFLKSFTRWSRSMRQPQDLAVGFLPSLWSFLVNSKALAPIAVVPVSTTLVCFHPW